MRQYDRRHDSHKHPIRKTKSKKQKILEFLENNPNDWKVGDTVVTSHTVWFGLCCCMMFIFVLRRLF